MNVASVSDPSLSLPFASCVPVGEIAGERVT